MLHCVWGINWYDGVITQNVYPRPYLFFSRLLREKKKISTSSSGLKGGTLHVYHHNSTTQYTLLHRAMDPFSGVMILTIERHIFIASNQTPQERASVENYERYPTIFIFIIR